MENRAKTGLFGHFSSKTERWDPTYRPLLAWQHVFERVCIAQKPNVLYIGAATQVPSREHVPVLT
jgi:hypothetical protein